VGKNLLDYLGVFDTGDDLHRPSAGPAGLDVDAKYPLQALGLNSPCTIDGAPNNASQDRKKRRRISHNHLAFKEGPALVDSDRRAGGRFC